MTMETLSACNEEGHGFRHHQGVKYLKSVKGGITAWSEELDSKVPR